MANFVFSHDRAAERRTNGKKEGGNEYEIPNLGCSARYSIL